MTKKRVVVHAECPACACGDISFIPPEKMKEKFIGKIDKLGLNVINLDGEKLATEEFRRAAAAAGKLTTVVIKPAELLLHAWRPAIELA